MKYKTKTSDTEMYRICKFLVNKDIKFKVTTSPPVKIPQAS